MKKLVLLHDVQPEDSIDDLIDMTTAAIWVDETPPEDPDEEKVGSTPLPKTLKMRTLPRRSRTS